VIAIVTASDLPERDRHGTVVVFRSLTLNESRGYATPISVVQETWTSMSEYCRFMRLPQYELFPLPEPNTASTLLFERIIKPGAK
jgi:hypothetical protein